FAPPWLDPSRVFVIPPSIHPLATKNVPMDRETAHRVVAWYGLRQGPVSGTPVSFTARDGSPRLAGRRAGRGRTRRAPPRGGPPAWTPRSSSRSPGGIR